MSTSTGHDGQSVYDGLGSPEDYAEWMLKNAGEDSGALAITNHGSMNSIGAIAAAQKKYKKSGAPVKFIYGVESYFIPSLEDWRVSKLKRELEVKEKKKQQQVEDEEDFVIENEKESKSRFQNSIERRNHLVLVAYNQVGLKNLYRLVSRSYRDGFYRKPRIDFAMLKQLNEGLIASSACLAGIPAWCTFQGENYESLYDKELLPLMELFGKDRFFLELQFNRIDEQHLVNKHIIDYAKKTGYKLIATADCHYPSPDMFKDREIYKLLGYQMQKENIDLSILDKKISDLDCELYLKSGDQMFAAYKDSFGKQFEDDALIRDAIQRTFDIAHGLIEHVSPDDKIKLPKVFVESEKVKTPFDNLKQLCFDGLKNKKLTSKEYIDRAAYELGVIKKLGVEEYFLALKEMLDVIRKTQLTGTGRGSGAGSLVCYLLNITFLDPIRNKLLFERFLSPARAEMPDIDSDMEDKEGAFEAIKFHFGMANVLSISNYNRLQLKSLVKDISRLYSIPFEETNTCTKMIEKEARDSILEEVGDDQKLYELTYERAMRYSPTFKQYIKRYPQVGERIENLYREVKSIGKHAGGVLVVPDAEANLPIIRIRGADQCPITEGITAQHLKYFGLVKFDMLGLTTLKIIRRAIELILKSQQLAPTMDAIWGFYNSNLHPDVVDPEDSRVFQRCYQGGNFPSIFQFAEKSVQRFCVKAEPESVGDLSNITSLWRPGPLRSGADKRYIFYSEADVRKEHPIIQNILGETRGLLLYQEQFMLLANKLAGFTLEESDKLRKLLVKPSHELGEEMKKERIVAGEKFIEGCVESGMTEDRATRLWEKEIMGFISYGFNKSHAMSYAYNSYQCAWLFTYFEKEWVQACLERDPDPVEAINAVRGLGYQVAKVDVNNSTVSEWSIDDNHTCYPPFTSLKGIGDSASSEIVRIRTEPFKSLEDFFYDPTTGEWRWSKANKKTIETLIKMECFDSLGCVGGDKAFKNHKHMFDFVAENLDKLRKKKISISEASHMLVDDWQVADKIAFQKEIIGFYDKSLIVDKFMKTFNEFNIDAIDECKDETRKRKIWAVIEKIVQKVAKNGKPFVTITVSGMSAKQYSFRAWDVVADKSDIWKEGNVVVFGLDYEEEWGYNLGSWLKPLRITK